MHQHKPAWVEHQRKRWTRPNAHLWIRHDAYRFAPPGAPRWVGKDVVRYFCSNPASDSPAQSFDGEVELDLAAERAALLRFKSELASLKAELKFRRLLHARKYSPDQPRVPAGNPDGGQWTSSEGTDSGVGRHDPRVISDATPDNEWKPGAQYAANRPRGSGPIRIGGRLVEIEPGQAARLAEAEARAQGAIARVRELDPNWRPRPSTYESVEGLIRTHEAEAQEAQARAAELARRGIGPGPFAFESIPARGFDRNFTSEERREINRIGSQFGCHTCGTSDPGTRTGNWILDHQDPTALRSPRSPSLYPHCASCSAAQGGWVRSLLRSR